MKKIIIRSERCTGCRLCESICALYNDGVNEPSRARIRIVKKHSLGLNSPTVCYQCKNPPCAKACPVDAIKKESDGLVRIDYDRCIGCEACVGQCPFGVMMALPDRVVKCELCQGDPQCVKYCATEAIVYDDFEKTTHGKRLRQLEVALESREA